MFSRAHSREPAPRFVALTQTCRLIRTEFRPLYLRDTKFHVKLYEGFDFVSTFLRPGVENHNISGDLHLDGLGREDTDILPLLKIYAQAPALKIHILKVPEGEKALVNSVWNRNHPVWVAYIHSEVTRITVRVPQEEWWTYGIVIHVRPAYDGKASTANFKTDYYMWTSRLGLSHAAMKVRLVPSFDWHMARVGLGKYDSRSKMTALMIRREIAGESGRSKAELRAGKRAFALARRASMGTPQ